MDTIRSLSLRTKETTRSGVGYTSLCLSFYIHHHTSLTYLPPPGTSWCDILLHRGKAKSLYSKGYNEATKKNLKKKKKKERIFQWFKFTALYWEHCSCPWLHVTPRLQVRHAYILSSVESLLKSEPGYWNDVVWAGTPLPTLLLALLDLVRFLCPTLNPRY